MIGSSRPSEPRCRSIFGHGVGKKSSNNPKSVADGNNTAKSPPRALKRVALFRATVHFFTANKSHNDQTIADPVVGKTYHCERTDQQLTVTTPEGLVPPLAEYKVVTRAMESLGKPNPLANFLANKTVAVGERLELPAEVAQQVLGFDEKMGDVEKFTLTLTSIEKMVAHFEAEIEANRLWLLPDAPFNRRPLS